MVNFVSDAAFAVGATHNIVSWNAGAQLLLGYSSDEVIGQPCHDVLQAVLPSGEPLCTPNCEVGHCFDLGQPLAVPLCYARCKNCQSIPVSLSSLVMPPELSCNTPDNPVAMVFFRPYQEKPNRFIQFHSPRIFTFGHFGLVVGGCGLAVEKWKRKQALTLLKYLVTYRDHAVPRERLVECLWPEVDERRGWERLKVTIYYLRSQLRAAGIQDDVVETSGRSYLVRSDRVWIDTDTFETLISEGAMLQSRHKWDEALNCYKQAKHLYRGDYLEEDIYEDWCAEERERLRELYLDMLGDMAQCYGDLGRCRDAARICRTALVCEPCREAFHRALMTYLNRLG
ncbi:MAG: winged helix-turn-helix domain-containing protein, partial [Proteobacteria bacterium]|nr:winged helix-turn-helix domain-containing protein [Pseudomonadota bacterium]